MKIKSKISGVLKAMEERPETFKLTEHTLDDTETGVEFWISNGFWFYGTWRPVDKGFNFFDKCLFSFSYKKWKKWNQQTNRKNPNKDQNALLEKHYGN